MIEIPNRSSRWQHSNGQIYTVVIVANIGSDRDEYPTTVVYQSTDTGKMWAKPLDNFMAKMQPFTG